MSSSSWSDGNVINRVDEEKKVPRTTRKRRSPWSIIKDDFEKSKSLEPPGLEVPPEADILVVGGGVIGSSVAYWMSQWNPRNSKIVVVERDPLYTRASTMLSAGGIRHQFSVPENVQLSMFTSQFLRDIKDHLSVIHESPPDVQFNHQGYLFLAAPRHAEELAANVAMQKEQGAKVELFSKKQLAEKYPWMNLDGVECGSLGLEGEGWFDPWSLVRALKQKNISNGVTYVHGELIDFVFKTADTDPNVNGDDMFLESGVIRYKDGREFDCKFAKVVNCAGPWAADIAEMAFIGKGTGQLETPLPVEPRKRFVYVTHCPEGPMLDCPFVIDPSGVYVRREGLGGHYICGTSPSSEEEEPEIANFDIDYDLYNEHIWPAIAHRIPAFNNSKLKSAWAGYYDYNAFDQNLVIGPHPYFHNFYFANGLSGHGLQHALAIGHAIKEHILDDKYSTIDLSRFHFDRFIAKQPIEEGNIV